MTIEAIGLCKHFAQLAAVDQLDLQISLGEIYGLIGPNGAGKTTALRMLAGLMQPTNGIALICGKDVVRSCEQAKALIGFHTGSTALYGRLTVKEVLSYFGQLYGLSFKQVTERIHALSEQLQFSNLLDRRCNRLSTGEKQRVSLARALVHDPPVVILDEPTAGLDVLASRFVADFIRQAREKQRAILFSTHYLTEAELLCDRIGMIHCGRLVIEGAPTKIKDDLCASTLEEAFLRLVEQGSRSS
ncbi:MAG: ATP-binding cassette domain-containing protein [Pseudomonadota bacterium]